ncbi:Retrovirus-related Pol polyprotein from transposon 17.6 [Vitis vinifera]|uniref:Retrovirus-related Pol polyprotein from transposon 17.6 n=1 Tax=Vitis vinifera TaxID=29760 RepID=A0A438HIC3_VITVI|nr:Retrovirus-related Pol polyprotein from transposon 17.6 [Vitis vinifera]
MQEVVRVEVLKLLQAGIIYPISDSPWVSPTQVVPKKSGITRLNAVTRNDHFPLPFIDQMLERVSRHPFYCFLDDYSGRMPFGLCNAPATFQRCMLSIFSDMVERIMEVFMDDITIYGRIFIGHIISKQGIEVDKAKVELIVKLPSPTNVKGMPKEFEELKLFLTTAPIVRAPNWQLPFEVMCDAIDFAIGAILRQREDGKPYVIYYANHLSRLAIAHNSHGLPINDGFPEESLMLVEIAPWYAHIANYLVTGEVPSEWKTQDKKHFFAKIHVYYWEESFLLKYCADQIIRKYIPEEEQQGSLGIAMKMHVEATLLLRRQP